jgi:hypothetical protein
MIPFGMEYRDYTPMSNACNPSFGSACYADTTNTLYVVDSEECAVQFAKRYNVSDPAVVSQLAEVNVEIDAACGQLKTKVHHPPVYGRQCTTLHAVYTLECH